MDSVKKFTIPAQLRFPLFYGEDQSVTINISSINKLNPFFSFEIVFYGNSDSIIKPWEDRNEMIEELLADWEQVKVELIKLHQERSNRIEELMKSGIAIFFMLLFWSNGKPVQLLNWQNELKMFKAKAVNTEERLQFILQKPNLYHAFVQLSELIIEQKKQYAKLAALSSYKK